MQVKGLRLATEDEVWAWTGCVPGAVPPFGSVFEPRPAQTILDVSIQGEEGGRSSRGNRKRSMYIRRMKSLTALLFPRSFISEQGSTINFNAGLRTESVQMGVADYIRVEQPVVADIATSD
jgi:prolyl-tRNA editing enzyme YbaK/EbsC (Cys-tRNA(Pro) deacylase)